ncbi:MAG: hypothetical protein QNK24_03685, partial [Desulfuromusa sp.]|nr:hypothetical protein [Desulfuromusa sp.]
FCSYWQITANNGTGYRLCLKPYYWPQAHTDNCGTTLRFNSQKSQQSKKGQKQFTGMQGI